MNRAKPTQQASKNKLPAPSAQTASSPLEEIPHILPNGKILGFYPKKVIHNGKKPKLHPTTLVFVLKGSEIVFGNKIAKVLTLSKNVNPPKGTKPKYDIVGGHLDRADVRGGTQVTAACYRRAAEREISEELVQLNGKRIAKSKLKLVTSLFPLGKIKYNGPSAGTGRNLEISMVYVYFLPKEIENNICLQDDYNDKNGTHTTSQFPTRSMSLDKLLKLYQSSPELFLDGLGRCLRHYLTL